MALYIVYQFNKIYFGFFNESRELIFLYLKLFNILFEPFFFCGGF